MGTSKIRHRSFLCLASAAAVSVGLVAGPASADDPPGNNGVIKLDGIEFDNHVNNEPHVGCVFQLDFYNYDQGDHYAAIRFVVIPPTGDNVVIRRARQFIGEDAASGGTDLDASRTFNLSSALRSYMAHPQQGYHLKVVVNAPGSIGDDRKQKVFWVEACEDVNS